MTASPPGFLLFPLDGQRDLEVLFGLRGAPGFAVQVCGVAESEAFGVPVADLADSEFIAAS